MKPKFTCITALAAGLLGGGLICGRVFAQDQNWYSPLSLPKFSSTVSALAIDSSGNVYAGGKFTANPGFNHIAIWTNQIWTNLPVGSTNGITNTVNTILVQGTNVFAGGNFAGIGGQYFGYIARWDGSQWHPLGNGASAGVGSNVYALASDGTNLYVGGSFTTAGGGSATNIAMWDGTNWYALAAGLGGSNSLVSAIAFAADGSIYAGGTFTNSGAAPINRIARWDGANWSNLDAGVNNQIQAITTIGTNLYIGGSFTNSGTNAIAGLARWSGSQWLAVSGGVSGGTVDALATDGTNLYVGGSFTTAGTNAANRIAKLTGTNWTALGSGLNNTVDALVFWQGVIYASGDFSTAGGVSANRFARWDGQQWSGFSALNGSQVNVITPAGTNVYIGGNFTTASGVSAKNLARWDGSHWTGLGIGTTNGVDTAPLSIAVSTNGQVYVGGSFAHAGAITTSGIARWDGTNWSALGGGINSGGLVYALAFDSSGNLYAGGKFTSISGVSVNNLARWDGTNWWDVGAGGVTSDVGVASVRALFIQGTNIFVGGAFDRAGLNFIYVSGIALWNGSQWSSLGPVPNPGSAGVESFAYDGTNLYASGSFTQLGGVNTTNLAMWNGTNWSAVGYGVPKSSSFFTVTNYKNELIVGGNFTTLGGQPLLGLARLINNQWWPLGSGLAGTFPEANSLAVTSNGLFVVGIFTQAGTEAANNLAIWNLNNELPAIQITTPTNNSTFNGYQTIPISANAASANGPITSVEFFVDGASLGLSTTAPYAVGWSNLTSGPHTLSATATDVISASWSNSVGITVVLPLNGPIITQQPQSETLSNGDTVDLTVQATGTGTIDYQWFMDGTAIQGATSSSLVITNAQLVNSSVYTVQVSDSTGTNYSGKAPVSVLQPVAAIWQREIGLEIYTSPTIGEGGMVYLGSHDYDLFSFAPNGSFQWNFATTNYVDTSPAIDTNNFIYFGSDDGHVYSLNPDGTKRWSFNTSAQIGEAPAIGSDGTIYVGSLNNELLALNPDGSLKWKFATNNGIVCAPAIATNGTIYVTCGNSNLYAPSVPRAASCGHLPREPHFMAIRRSSTRTAPFTSPQPARTSSR